MSNPSTSAGFLPGSLRTVLIIEDEEDIAEIIKFSLEKNGYQVLTAQNGERGLEKVYECAPALIILDIGMPRMNGYEVCRVLKLRADTRTIPIIFLTGLDGERDAVLGLEMGADDYVRKPFEEEELLDRVEALFRKTIVLEPVLPAQNLNLGPVQISPKTGEVTVSGKLLKVSATEFQFLVLLASNPGKVFSRSQLRERVPSQRNEDFVDETIESLRKKLRQNGKYIVTVRGIGYRAEL